MVTVYRLCSARGTTPVDTESASQEHAPGRTHRNWPCMADCPYLRRVTHVMMRIAFRVTARIGPLDSPRTEAHPAFALAL